MIFENTHNWPLEHWHIELCSKCTLKCPRCSRQEVPDGLVNRDLTLQWFQDNFKGKLLSEVRKLTFCGDDGDPIYAKDLLKVLEWFRQQNSNIQFVIVTNGSYKTQKWWEQLGDILNENDHIHFSLDGWDQESNNIYRVNCDWQSILLGIKTLQKSTVFKTWAAIAFKFNEDKIDFMKDLAKDLGFDSFQLTLSTKFHKNYPSYPENDPLQPSDKYISHGRFTRSSSNLSGRSWTDNCLDIFTKRFTDTNTKQSIIPLCMIGNKGLYLNAEGKFYPCCWTALRYGHNTDIFTNIEVTKSLGEVLDDQKWLSLFKGMKSNSAPHECVEKCSAKKWNLDHATSW
tara:strand:+ start:2149 stop:3174 length:1026 start_codon:yes stop_codon:yes gene_type:complete